jgi:hypothetical protein
MAVYDMLNMPMCALALCRIERVDTIQAPLIAWECAEQSHLITHIMFLPIVETLFLFTLIPSQSRCVVLNSLFPVSVPPFPTKLFSDIRSVIKAF